MSEYLSPEIIAALSALVLSIIGFVISKIDNARLRSRLETLTDFLNNGKERYFTHCPTCGHKILLADVKIEAEKKE